MASRYEKILALNSALYQEKCDVIILAGALLKDNRENNYVAQLKLQNTSSKVIKGVDVRIEPLDVSGKAIGQIVEYSYLDFLAARGDSFGDRNAIIIKDSRVRNFSVSVVRVVYEDNSVVEYNSAEMIPIPIQRKLSEIFDEELVDKYISSTSTKSKFEPIVLHDKYLCTCGTVFNQEDEDKCFFCGVSANTSYKLMNHNCLVEMAAKVGEEAARKAQEKKNLSDEIAFLSESEIESDELAELKDQLQVFQGEYKQLGLFKRTEKKALQEQIDEVNKKIAIAVDTEKQRRQEKIAELQEKYKAYIPERFREFIDLKDSYRELTALKGITVYPEVKFGRYPQNSNDEITWQIVKVDGNRMLLLSKYGIENLPFHSDKENATWENCDIRKWLNGEFFRTSFDKEETELIAKVTVPAHKNPKYTSMDTGADTNDNIFLLSIKEASEIFSTNEERKCRPSQRIEQTLEDTDKYVLNMHNGLEWWLRSPGRSAQHHAEVPAMGWTGEDGKYATAPGLIRPAMWIEL